MLIGTPYHKKLNLDYLRGNSLHIELNNGRHRLYVSDCFSVIPKGGSGGFVHITNSSITNLGDELTDIFYSASNGTWLDDFTLWFGQGNDKILISTIPTHEANTTRIRTSLHGGAGDDTIHVVLDWEDHGSSLFTVQGQVSNSNLCQCLFAFIRLNPFVPRAER